MSAATPPANVILYGEGLPRTTASYEALVQALAEKAVQVTVPTHYAQVFDGPAEAVLNANSNLSLPAANSGNGKRRSDETQSFVSREQIISFLDRSTQNGQPDKVMGRGWNVLSDNALYFPHSPMGIDASRYLLSIQPELKRGRWLATELPFMFFPSSIVSPTLIATGHMYGYDVQRGMQLSALITMIKESSLISYSKRPLDHRRLFNQLLRSSIADVDSIGRCIDSGKLHNMMQIGAKTVALYSSIVESFSKQVQKKDA